MVGEPIDLASRLDADHLAALEALPSGLLSLSDIEPTRTAFDALLAAAPTKEMPADVSVEDVHVPGFDGDPEVLVRLYRPEGLDPGAPALYWIHGGGMVLGSVWWDDVACASRAASFQCLVASVEYRLAPEHPFPDPLNDCYAGLVWLADHAATLGIDAGRVVIGGASAGGGLAAGLALLARDRGGPAVSFQLLVYPMLDHRNVTASSHRIGDDRVWNRRANAIGWAAYLGTEGPESDGTDAGGEGVTPESSPAVSPYASPALAEDLAGLPPAYINVGEFDMFLDEDVAYAQALLAAGVPTELHVYPGAFHGSNGFVPESPISKRWTSHQEAALALALAGRIKPDR